MRMRHIFICWLPGSAIFLHIISKRQNFWKKLLNTKCVVWFSLQILSETFLILRRNERCMIKKMYIGRHLKYLLFLSDVDESWIFPTISKKYWSIKFHENPSSGSRVVPWRRRKRHTDMTPPRGAFRNFASAPKNEYKKSPQFLIIDDAHQVYLWWHARNANVIVMSPVCF